MPQPLPDPRWPKILSLAVHEFRTPMTVVAGYIRMLLKDRAGALNDQQRKLLEEAEKSCIRLTALLTEVSDLSNLEAGTAPFNRAPGDLHALVRTAVDQLPALPDREVPVSVELSSQPAPIAADAARLAHALTSVIAALRREIISAGGLTIREHRTPDGYELLMGDGETLDALTNEPPGAREVFDEWRGGIGLSLAVARRILNAHDGAIYAPPGGRKAGARIQLKSS